MSGASTRQICSLVDLAIGFARAIEDESLHGVVLDIRSTGFRLIERSHND